MGGGTYDESLGEISWQIPDLAPGQAGSVTFTLKINSELNGGEETTNTASIISIEEDKNYSNNTNSIQLAIDNKILLLRGFTQNSFVTNSRPELQISKKVLGKNQFYPNEPISYQIIIKNIGVEKAYRVSVYDNLLKDGVILNTYQWYLEEILPNEEITINYSIGIKIAQGGDVFQNKAHAEYYNASGYIYITDDASAEIEILNPQEEITGSEDGDSRKDFLAQAEEISFELYNAKIQARRIEQNVIKLASVKNEDDSNNYIVLPTISQNDNSISGNQKGQLDNRYNPLLASLASLPFPIKIILGILIIGIAVLAVKIIKEEKKKKEKIQ